MSDARDGGYAAWKRAKIERGLAQCRDRSAMIPADAIVTEFAAGRDGRSDGFR
ncbi:hypothetical protein [Sphingomonas beigongshangi]|uniref:hypothetical protein n=1 Tax=Sphingomonas beigongshangi TaxID=2782540 RepID=UPI00193B6545|nr:hypothetical protein [Sphingomonas beigongshangi]